MLVNNIYNPYSLPIFSPRSYSTIYEYPGGGPGVIPTTSLSESARSQQHQWRSSLSATNTPNSSHISHGNGNNTNTSIDERYNAYQMSEIDLIRQIQVNQDFFFSTRNSRGDNVRVYSTSGQPFKTRVSQLPRCPYAIDYQIENPHSIGAGTCLGARPYQEDRHRTVILNRPLNMCIFSIFDGHGGEAVSHRLEYHFHKALAVFLHESFEQNGMNSAWVCGQMQRISPRFYHFLIEMAIHQAFIAFDCEMRQEGLRRGGDANNGTSSVGQKHNIDIEEDDDTITNVYDKIGSTCATAIVMGPCVYIATLGDSRVVLFNGQGEILRESIDHKPDNKTEEDRIKSAGGQVTTKSSRDVARVNGILAVSRAFGDFQNKKSMIKDLHSSSQRIRSISRFDPRSGYVISMPDICSYWMDRPSMNYPVHLEGLFLAPRDNRISVRHPDHFPVNQLSLKTTPQSTNSSLSSPSESATTSTTSLSSMPSVPSVHSSPMMSSSSSSSTSSSQYDFIPIPGQEFLLLASDGFWDVMPGERGSMEAVQMALRLYKEESGNLKRVAERLLLYATTEKRSNDNITVMIIALYTASCGQTIHQQQQQQHQQYMAMAPQQGVGLVQTTSHPFLQTNSTMVSTIPPSTYSMNNMPTMPGMINPVQPMNTPPMMNITYPMNHLMTNNNNNNNNPLINNISTTSIPPTSLTSSVVPPAIQTQLRSFTPLQVGNTNPNSSSSSTIVPNHPLQSVTHSHQTPASPFHSRLRIHVNNPK